MFTSSNPHAQMQTHTNTPYVSVGSARQLPVHGADHVTAIPFNSHDPVKSTAVTVHAIPVNASVSMNGYANGAGAGAGVGAEDEGQCADLSSSAKKPKHVRIGMLLGFHAINMCLGAFAWLPAVFLTLVSIPLWCMRASAEDGGEGGCFARIARRLADTDIRLANYAVPFVLKQHEPIRRSPRLDAGVGPAVAKVFLYFSTVKLLTAFLSFIGVYGTIGTIVVAFASGGTSTGLPGNDTTFSESAGKYLLLLLLRFLIGCFSVLRTAPRSLMATRFFCGMSVEAQQQQADRVAGCAV